MAAKFPYFVGFLVNAAQLETLEHLAAAHDYTLSDALRALIEQAATQHPCATVASGVGQHNAHER